MGLTGRIDRHLLAVGLAAAQVALHKAFILGKAAIDDGIVGPLHAVHCHLLGKADMGCIILCHHQQAAGVLIDAVDDAGPDLAANAGKAALAVPEQGVDQGAVRVAGSRVDDHPFGLVDHQKVRILIDDVQRDLLRHSLNGLCIGDLQQDDIPCLELQALGRSLTVAEHMALRHKALQGAAGKAGILAAQEEVNALACTLGFHDIFTLLHGLLLLRALFRILVQLLQENDQHPERHANADTDICKIEHRKPHE